MKKIIIPIIVFCGIAFTCLGIYIGYGIGWWYEFNRSYMYEGTKLVSMKNKNHLTGYMPTEEVKTGLLGYVIITEQGKTFLGSLYLSDDMSAVEQYGERLLDFIKQHPEQNWKMENPPDQSSPCDYLMCIYVTNKDYNQYYVKYNQLVSTAIGP